MNWYRKASDSELSSRRENQISKLFSGQSFIGYRGAGEAMPRPTPVKLDEPTYDGFYIALLPEYADAYGPVISQYQIPPQKVLSTNGEGFALYKRYIRGLMERDDPHFWRLCDLSKEEMESVFSPEEITVDNDEWFNECISGMSIFLMGPFPEFLDMAKQEGFTCTFDDSDEVFLLFPDSVTYLGVYEGPLGTYTVRNSNS